MESMDLLAVTHRTALQFFFGWLNDIDEEKKIAGDELLYGASLLAHFATTSIASADTWPATPMDLHQIFQLFVLDQSGFGDPEVMEAAGSQTLFLTGFLGDQQKYRHNLQWYKTLGEGFYNQAARSAKEEARARMMKKMSAHFGRHASLHRRLNRELRENHMLINPLPPEPPPLIKLP